MPPEGVVLMGLAIVLVSGVLLLPLVRSLAERIRGRSDGPMREELQTLRDDVLQELQQVRHDVAELGERVDFAERLIAKQRDPERLARGDR
jgi:hypothetical protein